MTPTLVPGFAPPHFRPPSRPVRRGLSRALLGALVPWLALTVATAEPSPEKWRDDIERFAQQDAAQPPVTGGVVFVGSSSIRLWSTLAADFPDVPSLVNRGFGGSQLADCVHYIERLVLVHRPATVVVYAGENDLHAGRSPEAVLGDFRAFRAAVHAELPDTRIIFLAIKESPSRERVRAQVRRANQLIAGDCHADARCVFVDVATPMLGPGGEYRPELFQEDRLHLNAAGYALWSNLLRPHLQPVAAAAK